MDIQKYIDEHYMNLQEVIMAYDCSDEHVYRMVRAGILNPLKIKKGLLFDINELNKNIADLTRRQGHHKTKNNS